MAPWILPLAQTVMAAQQNAEDEARMRKDSEADIRAQRAQSLGYPSYGVQGARAARTARDQYGPENYLAGLMPILLANNKTQKGDKK